MASAFAMASPDGETFSTPPTTPMLPELLIKPSLSRRDSRPSNLRISNINTEWTSGIVLDPQASSEYGRELTPTARRSNSSPIVNGGEPHPTEFRPLTTHLPPQMEQPTRSPCFIHSHLNNSASLSEWLKAKRLQEAAGKKKRPHQLSVDETVYDKDEEKEYAGSLTARLAETAVGVREMSKQLGRARVLSTIQHVLIVTKARDNRLIKLTRELALYLMLTPRQGDRGLVVYVDAQLRTSRRFDAAGIKHDHPELFEPYLCRRNTYGTGNSPSASSSGGEDNGDSNEQGQLRYWTAEMCGSSPHLFDFVVTLGGDGTVLFTSWLFQRIVPPVLPFALGSLGFLTNFDFAQHRTVMESAIESGIRVNLRMRFTCTVYRAVNQLEGEKRKAIKRAETGEILMKGLGKAGWEALECGGTHHAEMLTGKEKQIMCFTTRPVESFEVINDLVVDRGPSPYVSLLELFADDDHLTTVQADGLCISTPTGSTAYSLSAGGSLVHPEIPSILITPLCPHTLSFRPMLLPDSMELRICVPFNSRSTAWASFDGRGRIELKQGDHITVTASKYPFPTVCADTQSTDWFSAISRTLNWNQREKQKSFVMLEESAKKRSSRRRSTTPGKTDTARKAAEEEELDDEDDEEDEEDEGFDIDDLSGTETEAKVGHVSPEQISTPEGDWEQHNAEVAAEALSRGNRYPSKVAFSKSGTESGVDSPSRFTDPLPHPPKVSPRHVQWTDGESTDRNPTTNGGGEPSSVASHSQSREKLLREHGDAVRTPTLHGHFGRGTGVNHHRGRSKSKETQDVGRRAFAVWGHDESDSNASDNDID